MVRVLPIHILVLCHLTSLKHRSVDSPFSHGLYYGTMSITDYQRGNAPEKRAEAEPLLQVEKRVDELFVRLDATAFKHFRADAQRRRKQYKVL